MRSPVTSDRDCGANHVYLTAYSNWLSTQKITANTMRAYLSRVRQFLLFVEYTQLSETALQDDAAAGDAMSLYLDFLRQTKRGNVTINANIDALNHFAQFLGIKVSLKRERAYARPAKKLTAAEQGRFVQAAEQQELARDRALGLLLFYNGLRISDCASLNIDQVGPGASFIQLASGVRLQLNERTSRALRHWLEQRRYLPEAGSPGAGLWLTSQGQRLSVPGISFVVRRIGWQAQLRLSVEMLRRTTLAESAQGLDAVALAEKFGGFVSRETLGRYSGGF